MVPLRTNISKYLNHPELIFQEDVEIFGLPVKYLDPQLIHLYNHTSVTGSELL